MLIQLAHSVFASRGLAPLTAPHGSDHEWSYQSDASSSLLPKLQASQLGLPVSSMFLKQEQLGQLKADLDPHTTQVFYICYWHSWISCRCVTRWLTRCRRVRKTGFLIYKYILFHWSPYITLLPYCCKERTIKTPHHLVLVCYLLSWLSIDNLWFFPTMYQYDLAIHWHTVVFAAVWLTGFLAAQPDPGAVHCR